MLYTIGHSNRSLDELLAILHAYDVQTLVDIRRFPRSRSNPQFNGEQLQAIGGLHYAYFEALGGRRANSKVDPEHNAGWRVPAFHNYADYAETPAFREALAQLLALAARETCAIMCAEAVWWRCHRRIVTDHLLAHGVEVVHLLALNQAEPAKLTPFAKIDSDRGVSYPAG